MVDNGELNLSNDIRVNHLFKENQQEWDEDIVRSMFSCDDAGRILQLRIPKYETKDRLVWMYTKNGSYSVKSGYHMWQENASSQTHVNNSACWNRLWKLNVPPKVKYFLWRFCRNNIPVRELLQKRNSYIPLICPMCNSENELLSHVFFGCSFASRCWQEKGLQFNLWEVEDAPIWLLDRLSVESYELLTTIAMTLWGIWFFRNKKIWENKVVTAQFAIDWSIRQVEDWKTAKDKVKSVQPVSRGGRRMSRPKWKAPAPGVFKANVDASVVLGDSSFAVGMVIRDNLGRFIDGKVMRIGREVSVLEAEAVGILEALAWIKTKPEVRMEVESDSLAAVQAIAGETYYHSEVGHVFAECKRLLASSNMISIHHVSRVANSVAHLLARIPCESNSYLNILSPPRHVLEAILIDVS